MKLLLTNDDGIDADGLKILHTVASQLGSSTIVAPAHGQSGCSHRITTDGALRIEQRQPGWIAVTGTPADCVRLALHGLISDADWVLAGVNAGGNLGADVWHSGTVAAAREAALHGKPSIAMSHYRRRNADYDWPRIAHWAGLTIRELLTRPTRPGIFWNVNFPHLTPQAPDPALIWCPLEPGALPLNYQSRDGHWHYAADYHKRQQTAGCDVDVCFGGNISVTELTVA